MGVVVNISRRRPTRRVAESAGETGQHVEQHAVVLRRNRDLHTLLRSLRAYGGQTLLDSPQLAFPSFLQDLTCSNGLPRDLSLSISIYLSSLLPRRLISPPRAKPSRAKSIAHQALFAQQAAPPSSPPGRSPDTPGPPYPAWLACVRPSLRARDYHRRSGPSPKSLTHRPSPRRSP